MNKLITTFIGAVIATASVSAFAGPDWYVIEKARKAKQMGAPMVSAQPVASPQAARLQGSVRPTEQDTANAAMMKECAGMMQKRN